jgi:hypothetical protein
MWSYYNLTRFFRIRSKLRKPGATSRGRVALKMRRVNGAISTGDHERGWLSRSDYSLEGCGILA